MSVETENANKQTTRQKIFELLEDPKSSKAAFVIGIFMIFVTACSIATFAVSSYYANLTKSLYALEIIYVVIFTVEYLTRLACSEKPFLWVIRPQNILDIIAIVPFYVGLVLKSNLSEAILLRSVRLLRLALVFKFKKWIPRKGRLAEKYSVFFYFLKCLMEQAKAVIPISTYIIIFEFIVFGEVVDDLGIIIGGQFAIIIGLFLFVEGLKFGLMPFAEVIGRHLPKQMSLIPMLLVAAFIGFIVTLAEPAIGTLTTLSDVTTREKAPYLVYLLVDLNYVLLVAVGVGVGIATALGLLRIIYGWTLKNLIFATVTPTVVLSIILMWTVPDMREIIGLAWDCGAITTGEVTGPVVLALSIGIAEHYGAVDQSIQLGFGIITLGSMVPVLTVEILGLLMMIKSKESIIAAGHETHHEPWYEKTPGEEFVLSLREVLPLVFFMAIIVKILLHQPFPSVQPEFGKKKKNKQVEVQQEEEQQHPPAQSNSTTPLLAGISAAFVGMIIFNFGLTYGLTGLGEQTGSRLPGVFTEVEEVEDSPKFKFGTGLFLIILFAWLLGFFATQAEPALFVIGKKLEKSGGMKKQHMVYAVCAGVGTGLSLGAVKIVYDTTIVYWILAAYTASLILTFFTDEFMINVAWDAAGVTTGTVTAPFVLALGISLATAVEGTDGFGLLSLGSIMPVVFLLGFHHTLRISKWIRNRVWPQEVELPNWELQELGA